MAPRTFVDRVDLATGTKTRLFESDTSMYESEPMPVDDDFTRFVVTRETEKTVPDQWLRDRTSGQLDAAHEQPRRHAGRDEACRGRRIQVTRADGYKLWVHVTLPPGYRDGTTAAGAVLVLSVRVHRPGVVRPHEAHVQQAQVPDAGPRSMEIMATQGYAVVQPDAPIFGRAGRMNDNYVPDLRNDLSAVIDELDRAGIIDRQRLGIGGHTYGAFSTVNAMVNTPFFKAGIAGDGNYNRTLTPNGFQSERRDLWDARETYLAMSPFLYADQLQGALLMYHSLEDQNTGTDPIELDPHVPRAAGHGQAGGAVHVSVRGSRPADRRRRCWISGHGGWRGWTCM